MSSDTYDKDFLLWTEQQVALYRDGNTFALDMPHIMEEIENLGREQKSIVQTLLRDILIFLIKFEYSPIVDGRYAWIDELLELRYKADSRFEISPSLKNYAGDLFRKAWAQARATSPFENIVPPDCPWSLEQALDMDFYPSR